MPFTNSTKQIILRGSWLDIYRQWKDSEVSEKFKCNLHTIFMKVPHNKTFWTWRPPDATDTRVHGQRRQK